MALPKILRGVVPARLLKRLLLLTTSRATLLAILFVAGPAHAASGTGEYAIKGAGNADCAAYMQARRDGGEVYGQFSGWLMGYVSAYNQVIPETYDVAPWQERDLLMALVENYCVNNGATRYSSAVLGLLSVIRPLRLANKSEPVRASHNGETITAQREVMRQLQRRLQQDGLYASTIDGLYGPGTRAAIISFQQRAGLPATGIPDQVTLYRALMPTS